MCNTQWIILLLTVTCFAISDCYFLTTHSNNARIKDGCQLPQYIENGNWSVDGSNGNLKPGDDVMLHTILTFTCNPGYALHPNVSSTSCNGTWGTIPTCIKTCVSPVTKVASASCTLDGSAVSCENPTHGTHAQVSCVSLYEPRFYERNISCKNGNWNYPLPYCKPACGLVSVDSIIKPMIVGGQNATEGAYPWVVGIYKQAHGKHICGASMIAPNVVLSAAHCFKSSDPKHYLLAAGKYYRKYHEPRDVHAQYSNIKLLVTHQKFNNGEPHHANDIAVLILETAFEITTFVRPVCVDFGHDFNSSTLIGKTGTIAGWGFTRSNNDPSDILKVLEVFYKTNATCKLAEDIKSYYIPFAPDKLCAGSLSAGEIACQGDSGGGLVYLQPNLVGNPDDYRYFIRGIVSIAPNKKRSSVGGCDEKALTLFTSIKHHALWMRDYAFNNSNEITYARRSQDGIVAYYSQKSR